MITELLVFIYVLLAIFLGVRIFTKTLSWFAETDRTVVPVSTASMVGWGFLAFFLALILEAIVLYSFRGGTTAFVLLAILVGPIEEGAKLLPFVAKRKETPMRRWSLTVKTAFVFGSIEAVMYFLLLISRGNLLGALFRMIVMMFHVAWTAVALEDALRGSLMKGYLRASLLHGLYDAPMLLLYAGNSAGVPLILAGIWAIVYLYHSIDGAFEFAVSYARKAVARRNESDVEEYSEEISMENGETWENGGEEDPRELTSSP
ncbi:PrsW family glutamic-type intramembrane protease [Thermococcus prieurii]